MAINRGPNIIRDGLVLCMDAADKNSYPGSGTTWFDLSGNNNNGTLINGPTFSGGNGGSIVLDGVDDYVSSASLSSLLLGSTTLTLSIWFYPTNLNNEYATLVDSLGRHLSLWIGTNGYGQWFTLGGVNTPYSTNFNWENNKWQIVTIVADSTSGKIIKNNYEIVESVAKGSSFTNQISFGNNPSGGGKNISGNYGKILLYNRDLSASEIQQNFNATKGRFNL
jgi:hypothetical protein